MLSPTHNSQTNTPRRRDRFIYLVLIGFGIAMILIAAIFLPTPSRSAGEAGKRYSSVNLPVNYRSEFVQYAIVQRPDGTSRNLYINPETVAFIQQGHNSIPNQTTIVIEGYYALKNADGEYHFDTQGRFVNGEPFEMIHVLEKRDDWRASDFVSENRIGNWNFGSFDSTTGGYFDENMSACFHCHNATSQTDFLYSARLLGRYIQTGEAQFFVCDLPDRIAC